MAYFAGWEFVDNEWRLGDPGIGPADKWMFSIAETFLAFITTKSADGTKSEYFFGTNPSHVYDLPAEELPVPDRDAFVSFFTSLYPTRSENIRNFLTTYYAGPDAHEPTYTHPRQSGTDLLIEWCQALDIPAPPLERE